MSLLLERTQVNTVKISLGNVAALCSIDVLQTSATIQIAYVNISLGGISKYGLCHDVQNDARLTYSSSVALIIVVFTFSTVQGHLGQCYLWENRIDL